MRSAGFGMPQHWFIVPHLDGPPSGGTIYNRELVRELSRLHVAVRTLSPLEARAALAQGVSGCYWVDSLFIHELEALALNNRERRPLGLLAHYLPSLVDQGDALTAASLSPAETYALARADAALAPSVYMQRTLRRLGLGDAAPCLVVEPGCLARGVLGEPAGRAGLRALMIANLTPGKGVKPFLAALGSQLSLDLDLELTIIGKLDADPAYARGCMALVEEQPALKRCVRFAGALPSVQVLEQLSASDVLVSASRMESFGMALAEARTLGVPIVALAGGNVAELADPEAGSVLVKDDLALARACLGLATDRSAHARAVALARAHARKPRAFAEAARELVNQLSGTELTFAP